MSYHGPTRMRPSGNERTQPRLLLRPELEIILQHDGLAIEMEILELGLLLQQIEQPIDQPDKA